MLDNDEGQCPLKICTLRPWGKCIGRGCSRHMPRHKVNHVSSALRLLIRARDNIILEWGLQICRKCTVKLVHQKNQISDVKFFNPKLHSLSNTYRQWYENKLKCEIKFWKSKYETTTKSYQELLQFHDSKRGPVPNCFSKQRNLPHYRLKRELNDDEKKLYEVYEDEVEDSLRSNRTWNRIQYKNLTNRDCYVWTGFTKRQLIKQAQEVSLPPEDIFLCRVRIYRYYTYTEQEMIFGYSGTSLKRNFILTLEILYTKYAKPRLLNASGAPPGISRNIINQCHTPQFVKKVRGLDEETRQDDQKSIVINQDSTYQYCEYIHTNHTIFKAIKSAHKKVPLLKIHIWSCTDGRPIWAVVCYSDFDHADGDIFSTCLNKQHLDACITDLENHPYSTLKETMARHERKHLCFHDLDICQQMRLLQELMNDPADNLISDNGYKTKDGRLKMPAEPPQGDDKRITTAAASWRRSITLIRQTCERMHAWCKRNNFCQQRIRVQDIQYVNKVWNVVMADIKFLEVKLMKDSYETNRFVDLLLALRFVLKAPIEKYYIPSYASGKLNQTKRDALVRKRQEQRQRRTAYVENYGSQMSERHSNLRNDTIVYENDEGNNSASLPRLHRLRSDSTSNHHASYHLHQQSEDDYTSSDTDEDQVSVNNNPVLLESEEFKSLKDITDYDTTFTKVATGYGEIIAYLEQTMKFAVLNYVYYNDPLHKEDVEKFIGKKYANKLAQEYIAKMDTDYSDFMLYQCRSNKYVFLFRNLTSKFKVSNSYDIIVSFAEIAYFNKAKQLLHLQNIIGKNINKKWADKITALQKYATKYDIHLPATRVAGSSHLDQGSIVQKYYNWIVAHQELVLGPDQNHWYLWLRNGGKDRYNNHNSNSTRAAPLSQQQKPEKQHLVSDYLSRHNKDILIQLTQRRIDLLKCKKEYRWHNYVIGNMRKPRLFQFALDHKIKFKDIATLHVAELKKYIFEFMHQNDPHNELHYTRYQNQEGDTYYQQICKHYKDLNDDDEEQQRGDINYESDDENAQQMRRLRQQRQIYDLHNKILNISDLAIEQIQEFANIHKIFGANKQFKYSSWTQNKLLDFCEKDATKEWFKIDNIRTKHGERRTRTKKLELVKDVIKEWQSQFWTEAQRRQFRQTDENSDDENSEDLKEEKEIDVFDSREEQTDNVIVTGNILRCHDVPGYIMAAEAKKAKDDDEWLKTFAMEQFWYDVDFDLWQTPLARLGITCSCRSGAQLPSCCAHSSAILWLIWFAIYEDIDNVYSLNTRDRKILNSKYSRIHNFAAYKQWIKDDNAKFGGISRFCHCKNEIETDEVVIFCDGC